MALDTINKRGSVLCTLPIPDGLIDQGDRQQLLWCYPGLLAVEQKIPYIRDVECSDFVQMTHASEDYLEQLIADSDLIDIAMNSFYEN